MWAIPKNVSVGDLVLLFICHLEAWARERCPPPIPETGGRVGPEVIRARELPLSLTSFSTQESRPYTFLRSTIETTPLEKELEEVRMSQP